MQPREGDGDVGWDRSDREGLLPYFRFIIDINASFWLEELKDKPETF